MPGLGSELKVRVLVDDHRAKGHRIRGGKSRASLLIGAAVLLAEYLRHSGYIV